MLTIMNVPFVKMHSDGNDFVIIDNEKSKFKFSLSKICSISDRNMGIGFDQFILLEKSTKFDVFMRIYNSDGKQVEMCGNAARCVAALLFSSKKKNTLIIETISNNIRAVLERSGEITIFMDIPKQTKKYFFLSKNINSKDVSFSSINKQFVAGMLVNMGNPHIVFVVQNVDKIKLENYGEKIEKNDLFKKNINVEIVQILKKKQIKVRFWERGAGLTKSCGSGIMASFYTCLKRNLCYSSVEVLLPVGKVFAKYDKKNISITGKANVSFLGQFKYE